MTFQTVGSGRFSGTGYHKVSETGRGQMASYYVVNKGYTSTTDSDHFGWFAEQTGIQTVTVNATMSKDGKKLVCKEHSSPTAQTFVRTK